MAFGQVRVQPHLYLPVPVYANHVLCRREIPDPKEDLLKTIESTQENVQVLRVRDVLYVTEPDGDVFDIYSSTVVGIAKFFDFFRVDKFGVDDGILTLAPFEKLKVLFILCGIMEVDLVLVDLLAGEVIAIEITESVLGT